MTSDCAPAADRTATPSQQRFNATLCQLHLHAVLPALEELLTVSEQAGNAVRGWNFALCLRVAGGAAVSLLFSEGHLTTRRDQAENCDVVLQFHTPSQVNRLFLGRLFVPPWPLAGWGKLGRLGPFFKLTTLLKASLEPSAAALREPHFRRAHLLLALRVLAAAVRIVGRLDPVSRDILAHTPAGLMELRIPFLDWTAWFSWDGHHELHGGLGSSPAPVSPDVVILFRDPSAVEAALTGRLDSTAAVNLGQIEVRGLIPLADGLSAVMDRVEVYLPPRRTA